MNGLEKIITLLSFEMTTPTVYGWFHILCLVLMVAFIVFLCFKRFNTKKFLLTLSIIMLVFELYKQLSFSYDGEDWEYQWYAFPFQFCSVPMYVALIAGLTKNKKLEKCLYSFLATYGMTAGIAVMLYPVTVFIPEVLIDIQTMVHHGFMVVIGAYLLINKEVEAEIKSLLYALIVFAVIILIALFGNIITYHLNIDGGLELFYISPYHTSQLPVYSIIYEKVPYIIFLFLYVLGFTLGGGLILLTTKLLRKIKMK